MLDLPQWNVKENADVTGHQLNPTAASLLGFLHNGPMTGWQLVATAQAVIGDFWSLTQSQVYRELAGMAGAGLVEAGDRGPRSRQPFSITPAGRAAFAGWSEREPAPETIRFPLLLAVAFGRHLRAGRLAASLAAHRAQHEQRLSRYEGQLAAARAAPAETDQFALATLDFGICYERAVLSWFDRLPPALTEPPA